MFRFGTVGLLVLIGCVAFQNCAPGKSQTQSSTPVELVDLNQLQDQMKTISESDLSCSTSADCQLIPIGEQPCGGPADYLLASVHNPQLQDLLNLAYEYTYQDKLQTHPETVGICMMQLPQEASCVGNICIKQIQ